MTALYLTLAIAALVAVMALVTWWINRSAVDREEDHAESERRVREIVSATGPAPLEAKRPRVRAGERSV